MTASTRSARLEGNTRLEGNIRIEGNTRLDSTVRSRRSRSFSKELRTPAPPSRANPERALLAFRADCAVCGSPEVDADEAMHNGLWLLGECGRCGHRWTAGPFDGPLPAPARLRPLAATRARTHTTAAA